MDIDWLRMPLVKNTITTVIVVLMVVLSAFQVNVSDSASVMGVIVSLGALGALVFGYSSFLYKTNNAEVPSENVTLNLTVTSIFLGAVLAFLVSLLFLSDLISGSLFPEITSTETAFIGAKAALRDVTLGTNGDFYKLLIWSFLAGFSQESVLKRLRGFGGSFGQVDQRLGG